MKYSQARQGRTFVIRLEDGDIVHEKIEQFAREGFFTALFFYTVSFYNK